MSESKEKDKRPSFLDRAREGLEAFLFDDGDSPKEAENEAPPPKPEPSTHRDAPPKEPASSVSAAPLPPTDPQVYDALEARIFGPEESDYARFAEVLRSLESAIADEPTRFKAALAVVRAQGLTETRILSALRTHLDALPQELTEFMKLAEQREAAEVQAKQEELGRIAQSVEAKTRQIADLHDDIQALNDQQDALVRQLGDQQAKIESAKSNFLVAHQTLSRKLNADMETLRRTMEGSPHGHSA